MSGLTNTKNTKNKFQFAIVLLGTIYASAEASYYGGYGCSFGGYGSYGHSYGGYDMVDIEVMDMERGPLMLRM